MSRIYLNRGWQYTDVFTDDMKGVPMLDGQAVVVPHTTGEVPYHYFDKALYEKDACYQRMLFAEPAWNAKRVFLTFEAVGHRAEVFVNGVPVAEHNCGYTAFTIDLSETLRYGTDNLITVHCDSRETLNQPPFGFVVDYMTFGGIYRDVYLEVKDRVHMENVFYRPSLNESPKTNGMRLERLQNLTIQGKLTTEITLSEDARAMARERRLFVCQFLEGKQISNQPLAPDGRTSTLAGQVKIWDVSSPSIYEVRTEIRLDGQTVDVNIAYIGFREIAWKNRGLFLNGRRLKLRGLNRHQSYPYVGYAMPQSMQEYDAKILKKELGLNAVRTSHYPQSQYFMDACDRLGILVFTEIPGWQYIGNETWRKIAEENTKEMVLQYRNHPSVFLWGVRINESRDCDELYSKTNHIAHKLDPARPTGGARCEKNMHLLEDIYTYNDFSHDGTNAGCEPKGSVTSVPEKPYLISEYGGHMYPTKSFDNEEHKTEHLLRHAAVLDVIAAHDDILGGLGWCMSDYNTHAEFGSGDRICYHGVMDMFRNPKPAAYLYAAQTNRSHVLYITSSMDIGEHPASRLGKNYIITNADTVKMYRNDVLIKEYKTKDSTYRNLRHGPILIDDYIGDEMQKKEKFSSRQAKLVKICLNGTAIDGEHMSMEVKKAAAELFMRYHMTMDDAKHLFRKYIGDWGGKSGEYRFDAIKDGVVVKSVIKKPMEQARIEVIVSSKELIEGISYDVAAFRVSVTDESGNVLPFYDEALKIEIAGPIEVIGKSPVFRGGYAGFYIRSVGETGDAVVRLSSGGLESRVVKLSVKKGNR